ncbi:MAG: cytochrome c oxidase subunit 3 [Acidimicrobiia bacterium]|nr:cytochrome c oxidase subunit 3 [Acidimicrobiia bacterium]MBA3801285.1 cytochrome c oxidase subunit 3 [Acidimicrobiia bacterium]
MQALAAAPAPAPRRQVLVGTAFACVAGTMLVGGMLAVWLVIRDRAIAAEGTWVPPDVAIPEVPSNIMLISFLALVVFAQWAVYAARRGERSSAALALGATGLVAIAVVNAQAFVYSQMELPIADTAYGPMFYAVTGVFLVLMVVGLAFTVVTAFRVLGGRSDGDVVAAHALYWYFVAAAFAAIWLIVYVTK